MKVWAEDDMRSTAVLLSSSVRCGAGCTQPEEKEEEERQSDRGVSRGK